MDSNKIQKITSHDTANKFYYWLQAHPEITHINSYELDRRDSGTVAALLFDGGKNRHWFDMDFMWAERAMLNDWIDAYNAGYGRGKVAPAVECVVYESWVDHDGRTGSHVDEIARFRSLANALDLAAERQYSVDMFHFDFEYRQDTVFFVVVV